MMEKLTYVPEQKTENGVRFLCQYALIDCVDSKDTQLGHILRRKK